MYTDLVRRVPDRAHVVIRVCAKVEDRGFLRAQEGAVFTNTCRSRHIEIVLQVLCPNTLDCCYS